MRAVFGLLFLAAFAVAAWTRALDFDPYSMSFFTKTYVEPSEDMPGEMRFVGWFLVGIGALLGFGGLSSIGKGRGNRRDLVVILCAAVEIAAIGGAFFAAAGSAEAHIAAKEAG